MDDCELPHGWHSGPLQEQVLLISKPSLEPLTLRKGGGRGGGGRKGGRGGRRGGEKDTGTIACQYRRVAET